MKGKDLYRKVRRALRERRAWMKKISKYNRELRRELMHGPLGRAYDRAILKAKQSVNA